MRAVSALAVLSIAAAACTVEPTQIVVVVHSDLPVPERLDAIRVVVTGPVRSADRGPFALAPGALPASFGVAPANGKASSRVTVEVWAREGGADLFRTFARTSFVEHKRLQLDLWLARRCLTEAAVCAEDDACGLRGCEDADVDPEELPRWRGPPPPDSVDAGGNGELDAGPDAAPEPDLPRAGLLGWADPGSSMVIGNVAAGPAGRLYWTGSLRGFGTVAGTPIGEAEVLRTWLACAEADRTGCWAPVSFESNTFLGNVALTVDGQGRIVFAQIGQGTITSSGADPRTIELDSPGTILSRHTPQTGEVELALGLQADSGGILSPLGLAGGDAGVALLYLCNGTFGGEACGAGFFMGVLDEDLGMACTVHVTGDSLSDVGVVSFGGSFAIRGVLETGLLTADGYDEVGGDDVAWIAAYDGDCVPGWPALRTYQGITGSLGLAPAGAMGDELVLVAGSDGTIVDDGVDPRSTVAGDWAFVDRLDARGRRIAADFVDVPLGAYLPFVARRADGSHGITALGAVPGVVGGVDAAPSLAWRRDVPDGARAFGLVAAAEGGAVTVVGPLDGPEVDFEETLPPVVPGPDQITPLFYWDFAPPP